jgi:Uma2 family endonuclease
MQEWPRRHRITVDNYHRMAEAGVFEHEARVELIEGEIVDMPPIGSRHAGKASRLADLLGDAIGGRAIVRTRWPLRLSEHSEVQPDIAVVKSRADYTTR